MDFNTDVGVAIFAKKKALEKLLKTDTIICDGTFKTVPRPFDQNYTFFAVFGEKWQQLNAKMRRLRNS